MRKFRNDIILIAVILLCASIGFLFFYIASPKDNLKALVYSDNELVLELSLDHEEEYTVTGALGEVRIKIFAGGVCMIASDCADKICMHQGKITRVNQTITCLPNKVYIKIIGNKEGADVIV